MKKLAALMTLLLTLSAHAADYPAPKEADWLAPTFRFHTGEILDNLRLHYTTIGAPTNPPVLILHGTAGSGPSMLTPTFAGALFGPGQPLDAQKYFIILPDALGAGKSAKPSDGLRARFPAYDYEDMVEAQYRLITEGLGLKHLRLVLGNSMGGMNTWLWAETHPDFMDALVPMASQPAAMSGRNWMMRRLLIESIRRDPAWAAGNYTEQPPSLRLVNVMFGIATAGGTLNYQSAAPPPPAPTSSSKPAYPPLHPPTPTTSSTNGTPPAITTRPPPWPASKPPSSRSTPPTTSATPPKPARCSKA